MRTSDIYVIVSEVTFLAGTDLYRAKRQAAKIALERDEYVTFAFNETKYIVGPSDIEQSVRVA